ncbi:MAG TPA: amidohydrolase family protein [Thermoanaerobaculia bacterium]|nr:amidohydrolase family protein [Thermoanaerobaculia bacterium]
MRPNRSLVFAALMLVSSAAFASDVDDARALFERNLAAIQKRDKAAYLACYLDSAELVRVAPEGPVLGFSDFAKQAGEKWPDTLVAEDLRLTPVSPGVVAGSYRYRVRYGAEEHSGLSERLFLKTPKGWRIAVTSAFESPAGTPPPPHAFTGATLVDGTGAPAVKNAVVVVRDGRIACAGPAAACAVPEGVAVTDAKGSWIVPGLVDAHVHFSQTGWADGRPDAFDVRASHPYDLVEKGLREHPERLFRSYVCSGVTSVFDVGGYPWTLDLPARAEDDSLAPRVAAAGPLLSTVDHWVTQPGERQFLFIKDEASAKADVAYLASRGAKAVKVWYLVRPDLPVTATTPAVLAAGEEAKKAGLPLIVHATGLAEAKVALRAGAKLLVHSVSDLPVDDEFLSLAKANGTFYDPTLVVLDGYVAVARGFAAHAPVAFDDPNGCVDPSTRARLAETARLELPKPVDLPRFEKRAAATRAVADANLRRVRDAGIPIAMGTDAGNPGTLHGPSVHAEMEAMQAAGLTPMEVLVAATSVAARAMGRDDVGTLAKGKRADFLLVGADPLLDIANLRKLNAVVRGGVYRTQTELRAIVAAEK